MSPAAAAITDEVRCAVDFLLARGERGIRRGDAVASAQAIEDLAPGLLRSVIDQGASSPQLNRLWTQLIRASISASDHREFLERLPERTQHWRQNLVAYPVAIDLAEAIDFPRRSLAASHVGAWISRVARESETEPMPDETRALVALAVLAGEHEGKSTASSVYIIMRGREVSLTAMSRARALAPHADALLRVVPEMVRRGARFDEGIVASLIATAESGTALLDGQL